MTHTTLVHAILSSVSYDDNFRYKSCRNSTLKTQLEDAKKIFVLQDCKTTTYYLRFFEL